MQLGVLLIDSGYVPNIIREAVTLAASPGQVIPSRGEGITAAGRPLEEWVYRQGERRGHYWGLFKQKKSPQRTLVFDTNYWKSQLRNGIVAAHGDPNSIGLNGDPREADFHTMFAEHLAAEYSTLTEGRGRKVEQWAVKPNSVDNHFLDCSVGCMVGVSFLGAVLPGSASSKPARVQPGQRPSLSALAGGRDGRT